MNLTKSIIETSILIIKGIEKEKQDRDNAKYKIILNKLKIKQL